MSKKPQKAIRTSHAAISADRLLVRSPEKSYVEEWTALLAKEHEPEFDTNEVAAVVFRLGAEWFAFPALWLYEVTENKVVHRIPHKRNPVVKGLVNLKGVLRICVSLHQLLEVEEPAVNTNDDRASYKRMICIQNEAGQWIFPVEEVYGVHHFDLSLIENVPVTVMKSRVNYLRGVFPWNGHNVSYLDQELLFPSILRSVS